MRALLVAAILLAAPPPAGWEVLTVPPKLAFPADHGTHAAFRTEWWYVTGELGDERGPRAGFQLTFFRRGLQPGRPPAGASALRARDLLAAHLAVADLRGGRMAFAERLRRVDGLLAGVAEGRLDVFLETWSLVMRPDGSLALAASDRATGTALDLRLVPRTPPIAHGEGGLSRKGPSPGNASAYVSLPLLAASGAITIGGRAHPALSGGAWLDHEWGTGQVAEGTAGWDWMGLRLDDGRALMLYRLRQAEGAASPFSSGTLVAPDGSTRHLAAADFELTPTGSWRSPRSGATYPSGWRVRVPSAALDLAVAPRLADSELVSQSTDTTYWEGPVAVSGSATGSGYVELTGYAGGPLGGRF